MNEAQKEAQRAFFARLLQQRLAAGRGLPRDVVDEDIDPSFWRSPPDEHGYAEWLPVERSTGYDWQAEAPELEPLHPSIHDWFDAFWFPRIEGVLGRFGLSLDGALPGLGLVSFRMTARGARRDAKGAILRVPIGVEADGLQVVVDNRTGEVGIEDWERGTVEPIASSLEELLRKLE